MNPPGLPTQKPIRTALGGLLVGYGFSSFYTAIVVVRRWEDRAPTVPDPARGLIYRHSEHGWITYFSAFQVTAFSFLMSGFLLVFVGALLMPKKNEKRWRQGKLLTFRTFDVDSDKLLYLSSIALGLGAAPLLAWTVGRALVAALVAHGLVWDVT